VIGVTELVVLLIWGTAVGLDLVTGPQIMIARPLVAGTVAGWLLGDVATGLLVGVLFELFQYDVLPVGASRYPEYGPATVAAVAAAHGIAGPAAVALGALVGLATAVAGGASLGVLRRLNTVALRAAAPRLESGTRASWLAHAAGVGRDAARPRP
jgi:PTS system mannose-specific IIC component